MWSIRKIIIITDVQVPAEKALFFILCLRPTNAACLRSGQSRDERLAEGQREGGGECREKWWAENGVKLTIWFASNDLQRLDEKGCD